MKKTHRVFISAALLCVVVHAEAKAGHITVDEVNAAPQTSTDTKKNNYGKIFDFTKSLDDYNKQLEQSRLMQEEYKQQLDQTKIAQEESKQQLELSRQILEQQRALINKYQEQSIRFDKILETWEKQQQLYQKYLDSLGKNNR